MTTLEVAVDRRAVAVAGRSQSPIAAAWRRLVASPAARAGLIMVVAFVLVALVTPAVHVYDARTDANLTLRLKPPTTAHPFGTDSLGRDILVRVLHATRVSLGLAVSAVAVATVIGSALGFLAGYLRGRVDLVVMFCMDIVLAFPATLLAIAIVAMIGPGLRNSLFAISLVSIPAYARLSRSSVLELREQEFVVAARGLGGSAWRVLAGHIVPNSLPPLIVQTTLSIAFAILEPGRAAAHAGVGRDARRLVQVLHERRLVGLLLSRGGHHALGARLQPARRRAARRARSAPGSGLTAPDEPRGGGSRSVAWIRSRS